MARATGNLQQQAAATGALQALAFCPSRGPTYARTIATHDALRPLVDMLERGPVPMCCAAAGCLCNLALACPENQVRSLLPVAQVGIVAACGVMHRSAVLCQALRCAIGHFLCCVH